MSKQIITKRDRFTLMSCLSVAIQVENEQLARFPHCAIPYRRRLRLFRALKRKLVKAWKIGL